MNWTEHLPKIWNLWYMKLQKHNGKLQFAVSHKKPDTIGL